MPLARLFALVLLLIAQTGCTPLSRVVLLPQDGQAGAVEVQTRGQTFRVDQAYGVAEVNRFGRLEPARSSEAAERQRHPTLVGPLPPAPQRFVLQFEPGTSQLTAASLAALEPVIAAARARQGGEIVVIGHTDRQGPADANDALSLRRAEAIKALLVERGFAADLILAVGRGERDPLVPTDDDVSEPQNRRAEVVVR